MKGALQGSLLDVADEVTIGSFDTSMRRIELTGGAWLDVRPHWISGADDLFARSYADTMVAILSLGAPRTFALRPRGGGPVRRHEVGHGDLLVMGGSCQRTWDHAIPKSARVAGPRISAQFRPRNVG